ncbi:carboxylesterase/lipase family protein [Microlunatus capsulatus]|uniref:Carboxylic ester hydrolase n=1 Tax=Microlunatus capsulatus TaxID=99117 RepID=A0ABS4Z7B2_9ACTN|nr:carboxylesterase family protein [Microlunatus capsulatus]MBP2416607.1 para-nitrobenzyl esterase [Microlunatus capsulatus]
MEQEHDTVVTVAAGRLQGVERDGVTSWLGVPYAAPPLGPRRFRAPAPVERWDGVRPAVRPAGAALQAPGLGGGKGLGPSVGEDCLYVNVHAPAGAPHDGRPRPVLVWLHGGAFTGGSGALYRGAPLAAQGDLVVVTVNYRLGVFGFVDLASAVDADVPSVLGLRDQVAALRWVQENVGAFGGDPGQVVVAGESAGSISVALLMTAPSTAGLFRGAVMQSGSHSLIHGDEARQEVARAYARRLGLGRGDGDRLWQLTPQELLAAQQAVDAEFPGTLPAAPWFDGDLVPGSLEEARRSTRPEVALLAGHNRDEISFFQTSRHDILPTTRPALVARLQAALGWEEAQRLLAHYPDSAAGTRALGTDLTFAGPTRHFAERHAGAGGATWSYRFDAAVPLLGATHAADLPYLWDWGGLPGLVLRGRRTPQRQALAGRMRQRWLAFARHLDPGPDWPALTLPERRTLVLDPAGDHVEDDPGAERRRAWAGRDVMPRP